MRSESSNGQEQSFCFGQSVEVEFMPARDSQSGSRKKKTGSRFGAGAPVALSAESAGLLLTDVLIAVLLIVLPFVMGGREALGHRILISLSLVLGLVWSLHQFRTGGRLVFLSVEPLLMAGVLLLWFQTSPQSMDTLQRLSPEYQRLLPDWGSTQLTLSKVTGEAAAAGQQAASAMPVWNTVSFTPVETQHGLLMLVAYSIIAVVVMQRIQSESDCSRIFRLVAVSAIAMAVFAVLQLATTNDRFFWFYRHPYTGTSDVLKGAFTNRNHFAQFLALAVGPLTWWMLQERRAHSDNAVSTIRQGLGPAQGNHSQFGNLINVRLLLLMCATAGVLLCVLMSLSRGGMLAAGIACVVVLAGLWKQESIQSSLALIIIGLGTVVIGGLLLMGQDDVEARVEQLASADADKIDQANGRRTIWKADLEVIRAFPLLGTGVGSHRDVYPIYMKELADFAAFEFTHAESSYLHLALETGLLGVSLLVAGLVVVLGRILVSVLRKTESRRGEYSAAVLASLAGGAVHATADFIWYVPAIVVTTIMLGVTGLRLCSDFKQVRGLSIPRPLWLAPALACGAALLAVQPELSRRHQGEKHYNQYLIATFDEQQNIGYPGEPEEELEELPEAVLSESPQDPEETVSATEPGGNGDGLADYRQDAAQKEQNETLASTQKRLQMLIESLKENPRQPRVQLLLASLCLNLFEQLQQKSDNPLTLVQISDTVASSQFSSAAEMQDWLQKAFGKSIRLPFLADQMARQSLRSCPILGGSYLVLAETAFLRDPSMAAQAPFVNQALLVREHDPRTRFFAGERELLVGRQGEALKHWGVVFHSNQDFRRKITRILARMAPASYVMEKFEPNTVELQDVLQVYVELNRTWDLQPLMLAIEKSVAAEADRLPVDTQVSALMKAYDVAWKLKLQDKAEALLKQAMACDDTAYWPRRSYGLLLYETERYAEASKVLLWCYDQRPGDERLDRLIRDARRRAVLQDVPVVPAGYQR